MVHIPLNIRIPSSHETDFERQHDQPGPLPIFHEPSDFDCLSDFAIDVERTHLLSGGESIAVASPIRDTVWGRIIRPGNPRYG